MSGTRGGLRPHRGDGDRAGAGAAAAGRPRGDGGQVRGCPVRLARRRRRRLGRHDRRRQVPPRRLVRAPGRRRSLRRRPPEELHPRRPATVSGTRYARWRWEAPPGTGITAVRGTWWHALHDGMEQRIGRRHLERRLRRLRRRRRTTDATPREFVAGFDPAQPALEDRLLCARAESKWCSLDAGSWSAIRALTITIQDDSGSGRGDRRRRARRRLAARHAGRRILGQRRRRRRAFRRDRGRRRPGQPHRVRLCEGLDRRRVAGRPRCALRPRASPAARRSTPPASATAHTPSATAPPTSPATGLHRRSDLLHRQQPAGAPA